MTTTEAATILPYEARLELMAASRVGQPESLQRQIAVNRATDRIKAQYPQFFHKEQRNESET